MSETTPEAEVTNAGSEQDVTGDVDRRSYDIFEANVGLADFEDVAE
ncbi:hypothetical protein [Streptomyces sp. NPDC091268]